MTINALNKYTNYNAIDWTQQNAINQEEPNGYMFTKYIAYSVSLYFNFVIVQVTALIETLAGALGLQYKGRWAWWNPVIQTENGSTLYLGAIPLVVKLFGITIRNDADRLEKLGIKAVLSVTESYENNAQGCFLSAVTPKQWKDKNINQLQLPTPDFLPITLEKVHQGVEFIHWNLQAGRSVYVHCKAGRARSAIEEMCYLIKYHHMTAEDALEFLRAKRKQVEFSPDKWECIKEYERSLGRVVI